MQRSILNGYYRLAARLYRLRILLMASFAMAVICVGWALFSKQAFSDRYLLPAMVLSAWLLLSLSAAYHSHRPEPVSRDISFFQRCIQGTRRTISYGLAWLIIVCSLALLWFSFTTLRLFLNGGSY